VTFDLEMKDPSGQNAGVDEMSSGYLQRSERNTPSGHYAHVHEVSSRYLQRFRSNVLDKSNLTFDLYI
jgi:hypothetical protein